MKRYCLLIPVLFFLYFQYSCRDQKVPQKFFAGGFTEDNTPGMALFEMEPAGQVKFLEQIDAGPSPAWFCFSPRHSLIYAMNEVHEFLGTKGGGITTLHYDPASGKTEKRGEIVVPYGGPCHISFSADSSFLFVASYSSSSVAVVKLDAQGIPERVTDSILYEKEGENVSHPHMISHDPAGRYVYLADLGLNRLQVFSFDKETGRLLPLENGITELPEGSGPRHYIFNPDGSKLYVINELGSTIMVFNTGTEGRPGLIQTVPTVREGFEGRNSCAGIMAGKDMKFIYGSNRGENSIVVFNVGRDGLLTLAGHSDCGGNWPRSFNIDPSGRFLLCGNQRSDSIAVFSINKITGLPEGPICKAAMKAPAYIDFWK
jgi:6-phosphogluconolactonase